MDEDFKRFVDPFEKVYSIDDIPREGTFFVLTMSNSFLGKAIQGFMRLFQWLHWDKDTQLIPNHCDIVHNGEAIGALAKGVRKNPIEKHFDKKARYFFIVRPVLSKEQTDRLWKFATEQEGEGYRYLDIGRFALYTISLKWFGGNEQLDRDKWTCYSLGASSYNFAVEEEFFPKPFKTNPYQFVLIAYNHRGKRFV